MTAGRMISTSVLVVGTIWFWTTISNVAARNPYEKGCLYSRNLTAQIRVCGSDDPPDASVRGICRHAPFGYDEVRLLPGNWDSVRNNIKQYCSILLHVLLLF